MVQLSVENRSIIESPYYERQLITVVPDEVKKAEIEADQTLAQSDDNKSKNTDYIDLIKNILPAQRFFAELLVQIAVEVLKAVKELRQKGIGIVTVSSSSSSMLKFPPGHPRKKTLYVGHPAAPDIYFPFSDFHRLMFESKYSEAIKLLMALGASTLSIEHVTGWGTEFVTGAEIPAGHVKGKAKVEANRKEGKSIIFNASLDGNHKPEVPPDLVWFNYEPTWQVVADGRTKYGLKDFNLNISYNDDYGVSAKLKADVEKAGFEVGSCFQSHKDTIWKITGKFAGNGKIGDS